MRFRSAPLVFVAVATFSTLASATALRVEGEPTSVGGCNLVSGEVVRWKPSEGPPAAFIAEERATWLPKPKSWARSDRTSGARG